MSTKAFARRRLRMKALGVRVVSMFIVRSCSAPISACAPGGQREACAGRHEVVVAIVRAGDPGHAGQHVQAGGAGAVPGQQFAGAQAQGLAGGRVDGGGVRHRFRRRVLQPIGLPPVFGNRPARTPCSAASPRAVQMGSDDPLVLPTFRRMPAWSLLPAAKLRHLTARLNRPHRQHPEYVLQYQTTGSAAQRERPAAAAARECRPDPRRHRSGGSGAALGGERGRHDCRRIAEPPAAAAGHAPLGHALAGDTDTPSRRLVDRCAGLRSARLAALGAERGFTLIETDICSGRFDHVFRIHHGEPWSARLDVPLRRLGGIVAAPAAG